MKTLTFATGTLEEQCTLMCSLAVCKLKLVGKYARAAAPVLASKLALCERVFTNKYKFQLPQPALKKNSEPLPVTF